MKKNFKWVLISLSFIILSIIIYTIHYFIFRDSHHIFIYMLGDIGFLPIEVLLVTLVFHKVIDDKTKNEKLKKLNVVIGVFFSEVGLEIIKIFTNKDKNLHILQNSLLIQTDWTNKNFKSSAKLIKDFHYNVDIERSCLNDMNVFLISKRNFLLKILENPILIEHETFTDLMMALFHLEEELSRREDILSLDENDYEHLVLDLVRVYKLLFYEWLMYMNHLREEYPFLYSFAIRTNPFDPDASAEIK